MRQLPDLLLTVFAFFISMGFLVGGIAGGFKDRDKPAAPIVFVMSSFVYAVIGALLLHRYLSPGVSP